MNIFQKLEEADILDIYDEIAEIPISNEQVIKHCMTVPCKVDLRRCNLVHLVEQKYKDKLSTYKKSKTLKWLKVNLPRLFSNPEAKCLAWQERQQRKSKIEWLIRKAEAIEPLPPLTDGSLESNSENSSSPEVVFFNDTQMTSADNTFATVIPSQPKSSTEEILPGFSGLLNVSRSLDESLELPPIFSNSVSRTQRISGEHRESPSPGIQNKPEEICNKSPKNTTSLRINQKQSEGFSSEEDQYTLFDLDNMVTSTQEFG